MAEPWLKFFPSDWRSDPKLRMCSLAARGLWIEMMSIMHEADPYGSLVIDGRKLEPEHLAKLIGITQKEVRKAIAELQEFGVFSVDEDGTIYSRRMRRDWEKSKRNKENGQKGGNPRLKRHNGAGLTPSDNRRLNGEDKTHMPEARSQKPDTRIQKGKGGEDAPTRATPPPNPFEPWEQALFAIPEVHQTGLVVAPYGSIVQLQRDGYDLHSEVIPLVRADIASAIAKGREKRMSWSTIATRVREQREQDATARAIGSRPTLSAQAKADRNAIPTTPQAWEEMLAALRRGKFWPKAWGPRPNEPGCKAPPALLEPSDGTGWDLWEPGK